jgi:hypothetical protein
MAASIAFPPCRIASMAPRVAKGWTVAAAMLVVSRSGRQPKHLFGWLDNNPDPVTPANPKLTPLTEPAKNRRLENDRFSILIQASFSSGNIGGLIQTMAPRANVTEVAGLWVTGDTGLTPRAGAQRTVRNSLSMIVYLSLRMHS